VGAALVLPAEHRSFVGDLRYLTLPLDLAVTGYVLWLVRRGLAGARADHEAGTAGDVAMTAERALTHALGDRLWVRAIALEVAMLYYALGGRGERNRPATLAAFEVDPSASAIMIGLILVMAVETPALHFLLAQWSPRLAWVLTSLSVYSILWVIGDLRAMRRRPVLVDDQRLLVRVGLRCHAVIDRRAIASVQAPPDRGISWHEPGRINASRPATPNVVVVLQRPTIVTGMFGIRRAVTRLGLRLSQPARFRDAIITHSIDLHNA
jgi:hypothetical protein